MVAKVVTGTVNVTKYTPWTDDVIADDVLFEIAADARLVLTGDDQFQDDTLTGDGQLRIRGPLTISGSIGFWAQGDTHFVNDATITEMGEFIFGKSQDDAVVVRNLPGATWILEDDRISQDYGGSSFTNLGLIEQVGADNQSHISANFVSRGTVSAEGTLVFDNAARLFGTVEGAWTVFVDGLFLGGATVSIARLQAVSANVRFDVTVSSPQAEFGNIKLVGGAKLEFSATSNVSFSWVTGMGEIDFEGAATLSPSVADFNYPGQGNQVELQHDVKLVNSGQLTFVPNGPAASTALTVSATAGGGMIEIDNLAGATWTDTALSTAFNGARRRRRRGNSHQLFLICALRRKASLCPTPMLTAVLTSPGQCVHN